MTRAILAALLAAAIASPAAAERGPLLQQSERTFEAAGVRTLRVTNPRGLIEARRSPDGRIHVTAVKEVRARGTEGARLARDTGVETSRAGDLLDVQVHYRQAAALHISFFELFSGFETPRVEVRLTVLVPPGLAVELHSASGDLVTAGLSGTQRLVTTSGGIRIEGASGPVEANATSGDVEADGLGPARLRSVSGDIAVEHAAGSITAATTSGSITVKGEADSLRLESVSGDVDAEGARRLLHVVTTSGDVTARRIAYAASVSSSSGDVELHGVPGLARAEVSTVSGNATVGVAKDFSGTVDLQTSSGALDVALPVTLQTVNRRQLRGTIGHGTARIQLRSSSGDLHVTGEGSAS